MAGSDGGSERLRAISGRLGELLGGPAASSLRRLSSGASRETFVFEHAGRELVLQVERGASRLSSAPPQAPLLEAAAVAGVPVPSVIAHGGEDPVLGGAWLVVQALPGTTDPAAIVTAEGAAAEELLDGLAAALAAVHRMPADPALANPVDDPVALLRGAHDSLGEPHPTFELAFRALAGERPAGHPRALVHGDFRMGNLMVAGASLTGVLDWELAHLGDPVEDLGWLCVPAWRFGRPDRPAAGLGSRESLLEAYERHSGLRIDLDALRWWELAGTLRWGVICVMQAFTHLSGEVASVEHAVIGRRACEVEWDLLELLDPGGAATRAGPSAGGARESAPGGHDRPTTVELIEAARGALGGELLPLLEGRAAFQMRVSLRALGIVRRELELAREHAAVRAAALARVGCEDEAALSAAIRDGELDDRRAEVLATLHELVRCKLEVANPGYVGAQQNRPREEEP
jgi:aminoglycoside phosphotransferase (APT) family kinase protein